MSRGNKVGKITTINLEFWMEIVVEIVYRGALADGGKGRGPPPTLSRGRRTHGQLAVQLAEIFLTLKKLIRRERSLSDHITKIIIS